VDIQALHDECISISNLLIGLYDSAVLSCKKDNEEADAILYADFIDSREPLIQRLTELHGSLGGLPPEAVKILKSVAERDAEHQKTALSVMDSIKEAIKNINQGKKINNVYLQHS
jgi:hypothetical protein